MSTTRRALSVFALLFVAGLGPALARAQQATPAPQELTIAGPGKARWAPDADTARAWAAEKNDLVYFEIDAHVCGDCRRMQGLLYPAFDFEALLIGMVPVQIDIDTADGKRLAARYAITDTPSVLITTPTGRLVFLMQGFRNAPDFYQHVHADLDAYRKFARMIDAQDVPKLSAEEAYKTGKELYARYDFAAAAPRLERAATAPGGSPKLQEDALEGLAAAELELARTDRSRKAIERLLATTKDPQRKQNAELFRAQLALAEQNPAEALALYRKFAKDHPDSPYIEKVRDFIARLEPAKPKS